MESSQYTQWETSEEFEISDTNHQRRPWKTGWWMKQLPGGRPALPLYLIFTASSFLWIILLSMLLAKAMNLSNEVDDLHEKLERIQHNVSQELTKAKKDRDGIQSEMSHGLEAVRNENAAAKAKEIKKLEEWQLSLRTNLSQELAEGKKDRDDIRSEMFRGLEAVRNGNGSSCQSCPSPWRDFQGSCYFFSQNKLTWSQARDDCIEKKAHLVIINNQNEQKFLNPTEILGYWIGLTMVNGKDHIWIDGTGLSYTNWNPGEPNNSRGNEECVMMLHNGKWNDFTCEKSTDNYICEKRQIC